MLTLQTNICHLLGIEYPIIQAGMAGGPATPELAAAVSEAGGLGTLGAAYLAPDALREAITAIKSATSKPFAVNIFVSKEKGDFTRLVEVQRALAPFRSELNIEEPEISSSADWSRQQFDICVKMSVPVISTAFGLLDEAQVQAAKSAGIKIIAMATTVEEAKLAEQSGADAVVAQGSEAGGHRGTFSLDDHPDGAQIGTISLVPQIVDAVRIPVIAAGGIADGRGLIAALALGAEAGQIGTRFLIAEEAGTHTAYQQRIIDSTEEQTVITKSFSGRPARGIRNRFITEFEKTGTKPLPFPSHNTVTRDIRTAAAKQNNSEFMSLWAGQSLRLVNDKMPAAQIMQEIIQNAQSILKG
ncbi:NAD(P)H-dependent flavin oxidoreductase [Planococcus sp. CAU13]|uniref:NAD(P)H-dependent flavin oxidoreductase n=1 Tax=Planococcus sp. CAU13 TaxID=1541197 RepID=UPI00052FF33D|nr:nitronate monooxygenase [Planococcus sp. CAU13]